MLSWTKFHFAFEFGGEARKERRFKQTENKHEKIYRIRSYSASHWQSVDGLRDEFQEGNKFSLRFQYKKDTVRIGDVKYCIGCP